MQMPFTNDKMYQPLFLKIVYKQKINEIILYIKKNTIFINSL